MDRIGTLGWSRQAWGVGVWKVVDRPGAVSSGKSGMAWVALY